MKFKKLGRTDLDVSLICLGTMTWGDQNTEAEGHEQMDYALEEGINFFDTAELYAVPPKPETQGKTEEIIGTWFKARQNRDKVILASKITGPGLDWIRNGVPIDGAQIRAALEKNLKRLKTDYIDLYQLHWPNRPNYHWGSQWDFHPQGVVIKKERENFEEVLETVQDFINEGKIRHFGLSNESAWGTLQYTRLAEEKGLPRVASIQNEYSLLCRIFEPDLSEIALLEDVGLLAWSPLAGGMLSGKYLDGKRPEGSRWAMDDRPPHRDTSQGHAAVRAYMDVADKHGLDVCQMALAFVNQQPFVTANIIGATSMEQLKTNIGSIDITLGDDIMDDIKAVYRDYPMPY